ncbi:hypothetical protein [Aliicoccus persicus]|uniref:DUF4352 domain-containing protein n=1 Tax=Aliicoccus persicus TaxID=930138 RepID=A0A662Z7H5_9STAP|nr:hypothetical protein [Aliicoccus persicus]SEW14848.1 hypothetical protein SAMN05192557_1831 [Aliicoccus persicus]
MSEPQERKQDPGDLTPSEASAATKGCMLGVIFIILLIIAAVVTALIVFALNFFSDENMFEDFEFTLFDDITEFFESDSETDSDSNSNNTSDSSGVFPQTEEIGGLRITVNNAYFNESNDRQFIVDANIENIDRDYYSPSVTAFHIFTENGNAYAYTDDSREINNRESDTGEFNQQLEVGSEERFLIAFHVPEYLEFDVEKSLIFKDYQDDEEASFDLQ